MPPTDDLTSTWTGIVRWLDANAPGGFEALNPSATDADLRALADALGRRVPESLETLLRLNNGSTAKDTVQILQGHPGPVPDPHSRLVPGGKVLLDCRKIAQQHARYVGIAQENADPDWWMPGWIPFAEETEGHEGFLLDTGSPACPVLRYTETDHPRLYASSLAQFVAYLSSALVTGDNPRGTPFAGCHAHVVDGGLAWEH
ncbi:SMI1/KNR4 family protein [Kitasatospora sp. NPDC050463]|uniref:SMI1/KNR4 family protein n=1 Tax=Kitasatospora sp. NPDC050463 TaxID=3155786 RepID=UPI0033E79476